MPIAVDRSGVVISSKPGKFGFIRTAPREERGILFPHDQTEGDIAPVLHHDREGRPLARHVRKVPR
jgi:hypothetical protein